MKLEMLKQNPFFLDDAALAWVESVFNSLSTEEKIGQLLLDGSTRKVNKKRPVEMAGFHRRTTHSPDYLKESAHKMQRNAKVPMLLSADMDYLSYSINPEGTPFVNQMGAAASNDTKTAERMGILTGRECRALGFNWSFTPVVDINYNFRSQIVNIRSFGSDPDKVLSMASAYVKGLQSQGVAACLKHWPGDGVDDRDQHNIVSINSLDMETWRKTYGRNYRRLIEEGVLSVMSAHITLPAYYREKDPDFPVEEMLPGSLSKELNLDLLRGELGFNGLIITDASSMGGYNACGRRKELLPMSIQNGCDMIMFVKDFDEDFAAIKDAVQEGRLSRERLNEAVLRVLGLKAALKLHEQKENNSFSPTPEERAYLGCGEHRKWSAEAVDGSVTLVKDTQRILPASPGQYRRVLLIEGRAVGQFGERKKLNFKKNLASQGYLVTEYSRGVKITKEQFDLIIYAAAQECIMAKDNTRIDMAALMGNNMLAMERYWDDIPSILISFGSPYHLYDFPHSKTYINAYSSIEPVKQAAAEMVAGNKPFKGTSPVDPFCGLENARI